MKGSIEGWLMVLISSTACILGASVISLDICFKRKILENKSFLSACMSMGGGVLIFNSLYTLLPAASIKLSTVYTHACFFIGVLFTVSLTRFIQWCTPHAIHTCDPLSIKKGILFEEEAMNDSSNSSKCYSLSDPLLPSKHRSPSNYQPGPLTKHDMNYNTIDKIYHGHHHSNHHHHHHDSSHSNIDQKSNPHEHNHSNHNHNNNHHYNIKDDYYLIGIQTAVAICIHKFPEGLIMFVSNQASTQLGLSVAAAMIIHNFIEGFLIALPLYYATGSRLSAFLYASTLGGLAQPLGAVLGQLAISNVDPEQEQMLFGITFSIVSGMMCLIAIQSMLPQAIKADVSHRYVPFFFFLGIAFISLTSLLQSS
ncbi:Zinc/iron permease [Pilobolus umbonatus]|nr:Zinc/iron permease [Pilobolus umbonatus]